MKTPEARTHGRTSLMYAAQLATLAACAAEPAAVAVAPPEPQKPRRPPARKQAPFEVMGVASGVIRYDLTIEGSVELTFARARLPDRVLDELDGEFIGRIDLFAHLTEGRTLSLWMTHDNALVGARLLLDGKTPLLAGLYEGRLAPHGFYDTAGNAMSSDVLARPVTLRRITSRYGERFDSIRGTRAFHRGIDYGVPIGTQVLAVARGRVKRVGTSKSAGTYIIIEHRGGYESRYLHLSSVAAGLKRRTVVDRGQLIALSGNTGRSTGPHLHYELHLADSAIDPTAILPMPDVALGPHARGDHLAFLKHLESIDDRRAAQ